MKPASPGAPYTVPPEPSRVPAILLAVAVHALLLAFLYFGISWQSKTPVTVEAEVWDMKVESAAPPPPPAPEPEPQPEPEPTPVPPPPAPPVPKVVEPEPVKPAAPDIALEREKQRKLELAKKEQERERRELAEQKEREELKRKELAEQKQREEQKRKELAEQKQREEQKQKELAEKKKEEEKKLAEAKAAAEKKKLADEKAAKAKAAAAEKAQLDKLRDLELKRITGAAGTAGNAEKSSAPKIDAGYVARLTALIKSNTTYAGSTDQPGNPKVSFRVELLPTGEILSVRLAKSSGVPQFDDAVERGINKSSPLPKKKDGTVERNLVVNFSMKDLD